jgi:trehalose 6-phosphate phosphatase
MPAGEELVRKLAAEPQRAALLLDVDGVLAPIVPIPSDATVPPETRAELVRLRDRYGLVAGISGRAGDDARRILGIDGFVVVGEHGLELDPEAAAWHGRLESFVAGVDWDDVERKTLTMTFHYRRHPDEAAALAVLEPVAERARAAGLVPRFGRKVLELRPPLAANKGTAVAHLLAQHGLDRALYAGDDTTDLDAFRALEGLELGVRVAVSSKEGPPELREAADVVVDGPAEFLELLRSL